MQEMKEMFEDKFRELKQRNKLLFNQAVEEHFKSIHPQEDNQQLLLRDNTIRTDNLNSDEQRAMQQHFATEPAITQQPNGRNHQQR